MNNLSSYEKMSVGLVQDNSTNGSPWAVVTDADLLREFTDEIKQAGDNVRIYQLEGIGALVEVNPAVFDTILSKVDKRAQENYRHNYSTNRAKAIETFNKVITRMVKNVQKDGRIKEIGIFSVNSEQYATKLDGERVRAFQLDFKDISALLTNLEAELGVKFSIALGSNTLVNPTSLGNIPNFTKLQGIATTKQNNAVLVKIAIN